MSIYDKFMIDNPPDNHFERMKLNGLLIDLPDDCTFHTTTKFDVRLIYLRFNLYVSILHSTYSCEYIHEKYTDVYSLCVNGYTFTIHNGFWMTNTMYIPNVLITYKDRDLIEQLSGNVL